MREAVVKLPSLPRGMFALKNGLKYLGEEVMCNMLGAVSRDCRAVTACRVYTLTRDAFAY